LNLACFSTSYAAARDCGANAPDAPGPGRRAQAGYAEGQSQAKFRFQDGKLELYPLQSELSGISPVLCRSTGIVGSIYFTFTGQDIAISHASIGRLGPASKGPDSNAGSGCLCLVFQPRAPLEKKQKWAFFLLTQRFALRYKPPRTQLA
jgi:hypothetical protein